MKTYNLLLSILILFPLSLMAESVDKSDGCGTGWYVTKRHSLLGTSTRSTTHVVLPPTFSMTSGTSNCSSHTLAKKEEPALHFAIMNHDSLAQEISQGQGEFLSTLASAMGCKDKDQRIFARVAQSQFQEIFPTVETPPFNLYINLRQVVMSDPVLSTSCENVRRI